MPLLDNSLIRRELERVSDIRAALVVQHAFYASILLPLRIIADLTLPTWASTDGYERISINPLWTQALDRQQLGYVILHEAGGHIALLHALRKGTRDHERWNCAADLAANAMLDEIKDVHGKPLYRRPEHVEIPGVGVCSMLHADWAKDLASEPIYDRLSQQPTLPCCDPDTDSQATKPGPHSHHDHCHPGRTCLQISTPLTADQSERLVDRVLAAYETWKASNQRGSMPAGMIRHLERLRATRVPWQRLFHQFAGSALTKDDYSLSPPHRRWLSEANIIRPTLRSPQLAQLVVSIDTSGSVDRAMLTEFASELMALRHLADETLLLTHDATVHDVIPTAKIQARLASGTFHGGGGTSHQPVFEWMAAKRIQPDLFIGFTDLHSTFPERKPAYPVMWVAPEAHGTPPWGRVVVISDTD